MHPEAQRGVFPLTRNQREIYFEQLLHPDTPIFNIGGPVVIDGPLRPDLLAAAMRHGYRITPEFNTRIFEEGGIPLQRVAPREDFTPEIIDLSGLPDPEREAYRLMGRDFAEPLPFGPESPLSLLKIYALGPRRHIWYTKFHHIICDAWALPLLFRKVVGQYNCLIKGEADLAADAFRYEAFVAAEQAYAASEAFVKDRLYWEEKLSDPPPSYYPPRRAFAYDTGHEALVVPPEKFRRMEELAQQEKCSAFHLALAVLFSCLARSHRTDDVSVALPILNRRGHAFKETMGLFVNVLPLRLRLDTPRSARELLRHAARQLSQDYRHARFAVGHMMRDRLGAGGRSHLVEVSFSYERPLYEGDFEGCRSRVIPLDNGQQVRPLEIHLREYEPGAEVLVSFSHNISFIDRAQAKELVRQFEELLDLALRDPDAALCGESRPAAEAPAPAPALLREPDIDIVSMFERQAALHAGREAVTDGPRRLTYSELDRLSSRLSRLLLERGAGPERRVGLCLSRSYLIPVAALAALKAGAAYVPLDPSSPPLRLSHLVTDAGPGLILTTREDCGSLPADSTAPLLFLDELDEEGPDATPGEGAGVRVEPGQAAYVIYTSGTTGGPKGVVVTHANVTRLLRATAGEFGFTERDVWTLFHSYAFDFSVWEMWGALLYGGRLVVVPYEVSRSPESFYELLASERVSVLNQTPSAFRQLTQAEEAKGAESSGLGLRLVIFGGEALDVGGLRGWFGRHGDERPRLVNMYGITETTVHVTQRFLSKQDLGAGHASPIGRGLPGVEVYLLDAEMRPTRAGAEGEIYVGGGGVARGYWGRPSLTAERFLPDPFSSEPGARMYRSGDLGRRRAGGELEYLGRADSQVKVRGFRIELGEIEAAVCDHSGVSAAAVLALDANGSGRRLVCYASRRAGAEQVGVEELRRHVRERLPEYMVPAGFVLLERLPLNGNGKVDRHALAGMGWNGGAGAADYAAARDEREEALCRVWAEVLGVERVGVDDSFFALGGDSILALQVVARAQRQGFALTFKDLYERPTVRALAARGNGAKGNGAAPDYASPLAGLSESDRALLPDDAEDAFPLSSLQVGMLYHSERAPESAIFHDIFSFEIEVGWDERALREALDELTRTHPALRTSFDLARYGEPLQIVHRAASVPFEVTDIRGRGVGEQRLEVRQWVEREKRRGFSFNRAPLVRVHAHLLGDSRVQLTISFHHAVLDGWSVATLMTQLFLLYAGGRRPQGPRLKNDFRAFIYSEKASAASPDARRFWAEELGGLAGEQAAHARRPSARSQAKRRGVAVSKELGESLVRMSQRHGVPLKTVLLAAHLKALAEVCGRARPVTGYVTHNRPESDDVETLGLYLNTLPFVAPDADCSPGEFVRRVFGKERELLPHRGFPLAAIKQLNGARLPFDSGFNFVQFHAYGALLGVERFRLLDLQFFEETDFPLLAQFTRHPWTLELDLTLVYDPECFTEAEVTRAVASYSSALEELANEQRAEAPRAAEHSEGNGDRREPPAHVYSDFDVPYVAPADAVQRRLAALYEEVLGIERVGIRHNFFALGGDSILATRLVMRIRDEFQTGFPLDLLFQCPEIERLSEHLQSPAPAPGLPAVRPARRKLATVKIHGGD